jgi:hypothetical protein
MGTHNRLLKLGEGFYLELIAIDPQAPPPGRPRWFGLDRLELPVRPPAPDPLGGAQRGYRARHLAPAAGRRNPGHGTRRLSLADQRSAPTAACPATACCRP